MPTYYNNSIVKRTLFTDIVLEYMNIHDYNAQEMLKILHGTGQLDAESREVVFLGSRPRN
jgi:hypothetical protein